MEFRKLISFGRSSYVISMPKQWVIKNKLKKGDLISINDQGDELSISLNNDNIKKESKEITIQAENKNIDLIKAEIVSAYLNNYDAISIFSNNLKKDALEIKSILRNLTGMEVMEQTSKTIVARDLINKNEISLKTLIRRIDIITRAMIEDAINSIDGENHHESIAQRDTDVNRLQFLAYRVIKGASEDAGLAKSLKMSQWDLSMIGRMVLSLEKVADRQKRIARYLKNIKLSKSVASELKELYEEIKDAYLKTMKAYYNNDKKLALGVEITNRNRIIACEKFHTKSTGCPVRLKGKQKQGYCTEISRIVENLKAMTSSIKYISRSVIGMG